MREGREDQIDVRCATLPCRILRIDATSDLYHDDVLIVGKREDRTSSKARIQKMGEKIVGGTARVSCSYEFAHFEIFKSSRRSAYCT